MTEPSLIEPETPPGSGSALVSVLIFCRYHRYFRLGAYSKQQEDLSQFDLGPNVEVGAKLVRVGSDAKIYLISQNTARWIPTEEIRAKYNLGGNVHSVSANTFGSYGAGPAFA